MSTKPAAAAAQQLGQITVKPGETIGDASAGKRGKSLYIVQTGRLIVNIGKDEVLELHHAESPQCLGEEAIFGPTGVGNSAVAVEESQVLEVPIETAKGHYSKLTPLLSGVLKGLAERVRVASAELKTLKLARNALPCPPDYTAKVFGVTFHSARFVGKKQDDLLVATYQNFLDYAVNVMEETPYRMLQALRILAKLGYAKLDLEKSGTIEFKDMTQIEAFFDFYQNYHFKPGYASLLKTNDKITQITQTFLKLSRGYDADRSGLVHMPFKPTIDAMKEKLGSSFEADQLFRLEQKGLMIKRTTTQDGGILSFWRAEFEQMLLNWKVLREVELWNKKGFVEMTDGTVAPVPATAVPEASPAGKAAVLSLAERLAAWQPKVLQGKVPQIRTAPPAPGEIFCPTCMSTITAEQTLCEVCDSELTPTA